VHDLDVTAAYGIEAACPRKGQRGWRRPDSGQPVAEPQLDHAPAMPIQPTGQCDQGSCPAFGQVSIQTPAGPVGLRTHHYDTNFAALVLAGCDRTKHIGNLKPPGGQEPIMSKTPEPGIYQQEYERQEAARLAGVPLGQPGTYAVTPRPPRTPYQRKQAKLVAAVIGGPVLLLIGILAVVGGIGLAALANEKRVAYEQAAAASKSADS